MTLRRLVLVRHGETDFNADARIQGHLDPPLSAVGAAQARRVAPVLAGLRPERLLCSDLRRAVATAEELSAVCGLPAKADPRLRETRLGVWQGRTLVEVERDWPGLLQHWRADPTWAPPGGESRVEVAARARPVIEEIDAELASRPDEPELAETVLCCAHGGLISALTATLLGLPVAVWPALVGIGNCHWTVLGRRPGTGRWQLLGYNLAVAR